MGEKALAKLKGFTSTGVIHSNTNPHAAAALMGMTMAQSQASGPYFRVSEDFVAQVETFTQKDLDNFHLIDELAADFVSDWITYLDKSGLPACGLAYIEALTPSRNTMRFLNAYNRRIPAAAARTVHESRELSLPPRFQIEYATLIDLIRNGESLIPYLSRDVSRRKKADKNDPMLNSWGIHHLHLRPTGSDHLVFCMILEIDVFVIQVLPHNAQHRWVNTDLIQIVHDNWPHLIAHAKQPHLAPERMKLQKLDFLRSYNANFLVTVADGTVYAPMGGGITASGDALGDRINCVKIFSELRYWETFIKANAAQIRLALNVDVSHKLCVRMVFENHLCIFFETTRSVLLKGFSGER